MLNRIVLAASTPIRDLPNHGENSARVLGNIGIHTVDDLLEAFRRLRTVAQRPSLMLLWAMVAGLRGEHWQSVSVEEKVQLRAALEPSDGLARASASKGEHKVRPYVLISSHRRRA
jgi:hypothetical protein